jgi:hypothetical protein
VPRRSSSGPLSAVHAVAGRAGFPKPCASALSRGGR